MDGHPNLEIERPRSATELIGATFALYRRFPWLFLALAAVVIVPYVALEAILTSGLVHGTARGLLDFAFGVGDVALVLPLMYAVDDVRQDRVPEIRSVARRGIATLRVVSPAVFLSWLGITVGLVFLIVPGVILALRWAVVAQTGSLGAKSWKEALAHSRRLTRGRYGHVFAFLLLVFLITLIPTVVELPFFGLKTTTASFLIDVAISIPVNSFDALALAFLYFDLTARDKVVPAEPEQIAAVAAGAVPPTGDPLDPGSWTDEDRPPGWYVDPSSPWVMRCWVADGKGTWSKRTAKTPKKTLETWRDMRATREREARTEEPG
jgi:hypothetical protein